MKSRILTLKPYETVDISQYKVAFTPDEKKLEYELGRLRNPYITWTEGAVAAAGDIVVCRLASAAPKFNKEKMTYAVGCGMLPKALEQTMVGMQVNETREAAVGEDTVAVTLLSVKNKNVPPLSDEMVKALNLDGVDTVDDYRAYLLRQQRSKKAEEVGYDACQHIIDTVLEETEFVLHKADWENIVNMKIDRVRALCRQEGLVFEEMTQEEFAAGRIPGVKCFEGVIALERYYSWETLQMYLAGLYYAKLDGITLDTESYEGYIQEYMQSWGVTEENARESNSYEFYLIMEYAGYFRQKVWGYMEENIFVEE